MIFRWFLPFMLLSVAAFGTGLPSDTQQILVGIAPGWNTHRGHLIAMERSGKTWKPAGEPVPVLFGRSGLAWGRGIRGQGEQGPRKVEGDGRAPAGLFALGRIFGYAPAAPEGAGLDYHQVTEADAWIDDVRHPDYNKHVVVDPKNPPAWFPTQRMRLGDEAYKWKLEIRHNSDPPVANAGSAIFFHVRRGENRPTAGCTTMEESTLVELLQWLRPTARPCYVLLPKNEYVRVWKSWGLPDPKFLPPDMIQ